ncbi:MAG: ABC transporter permease/substrate-binding protein [Capsulimonadales bacterium]|nr:ABC transporter permease/substrate-binding protein [Capsulimonadales bacterium]
MNGLSLLGIRLDPVVLRRLGEQFERLPDFLGGHILLTLTALLFGLAATVPLTLLALRNGGLKGALLGGASIIQTIPSLALLALMVPLLGQIGFVPALIALSLYSLLPILRNTVTGLESTDPALLEAAEGVGMTPVQILLRVRLPLALPVIISGIRTATVWVVGTATLSTPVGAVSLGNYIFTGLQTQNPYAVLVGCVTAALLALLLDFLIRQMEIGVLGRSRRRTLMAALGVAVVASGALLPRLREAIRKSDAGDTGPTVVVGGKAFTEQYLLTEFLTRYLAREGFSPQKTAGMGSSLLFDALANGSVDVYVDYTGTIFANTMKRSDSPGRAEMFRQMSDFLRERHGIVTIGKLGFENTYALALPRARAEKLGIRTLEDLRRFAPGWVIGGDYEFFGRPEWTRLRNRYAFRFRNRVRMDAALMYDAVRRGQVDVISAFSTDGRIAAYDLVVLADERQAFPPYDAVLFLSAKGAEKAGLTEALRPLVGRFSDSTMRTANRIVDVDGGSVREAAAFLERTVLSGGTETPQSVSP